MTKVNRKTMRVIITKRLRQIRPAAPNNAHKEPYQGERGEKRDSRTPQYDKPKHSQHILISATQYKRTSGPESNDISEEGEARDRGV